MRKKMKIAIIVPSNLPIPSVRGGAIETLVDELIEINEQKKNLDIVVYSCKNEEAKRDAQRLKYTKIKYIDGNSIVAHLFSQKRKIIKKFMKSGLEFDSWFLKEACHDIAKEQVDFVIIEGDKATAESVKKRINRPLILHLHNEMNKESDRAEQIANHVDYYFTVSDYIGKKVMGVPGVNKESVFTIHNCVDTASFDKTLYAKEREIIRNKFDIKKEDILLIFTGRIVPEKGVLELIKAVLKSSDRIKLMILGTPTFDERKKTDYSREIEMAINQCKNRIFMTGYIEHKDIPQYYAAADIAVIPSLWEEPAGLTVFEPQATGIPCIVTNSGGITEYCNETTAIIVEKEKKIVVNELIEAIKVLEKSPQKREELGVNGRIYIQRYNTNNYYKEYVSALENLYEEENR